MIVSTQIMKGSEVRYLESERAYSFHSWANRSLEPARLAWFMTKYPVHSGNNVRKLPRGPMWCIRLESIPSKKQWREPPAFSY